MVSMQHGSSRIISLAACAAMMLLATGGRASEVDAPVTEEARSQIEQLIGRQLDRLFDHLQGVLEDLPRYALPEVTEDGDVIIRRLPRHPDRWPPEPASPNDILEL